MLLDKLRKIIAASQQQNISKYKLIGLEKESLRITPHGMLATTNHPKSLGSALTHNNITTDYAESQLELITRPHDKEENLLRELTDLHSFVYFNLTPKELLWPFSLPCLLPNNKDIAHAKYGSSAAAKLKEIYRIGLGYRYGKAMQLICGIHFNFSFDKDFWGCYFKTTNLKPEWNQDDINNQYMHIIRNYMRISWLPVYLFGASPVINSRFIDSNSATANYLKPLNANTYMAPYGTSIRESNLGYKNKNNIGLSISYNNLAQYINDLQKAVNTEDPEYKEIGKFRRDQQIQLNCNALQIANEYYGTVRPKSIATAKNIQSYKSLEENGIAYIELRNLDLNPFAPIGIESNQCLLLELLMYYCCFIDSPEFTIKERAIIKNNNEKTALLGRQPGLQLNNNNQNISLKDWALKISADLKIIADVLAAGAEKPEKYYNAILYYEELIKDPDKTLSAIIVNNLIRNNLDYTKYFLTIAKTNADYFNSNKLSQDKINYYQNAAQESLIKQKTMEKTDADNNFTLEQLLLIY